MGTLIISGLVSTADQLRLIPVYKVKISFRISNKNWSAETLTNNKGQFSFKVNLDISGRGSGVGGGIPGGGGIIPLPATQIFPAAGINCLFEVYTGTKKEEITDPMKRLTSWENKVSLVIPAAVKILTTTLTGGVSDQFSRQRVKDKMAVRITILRNLQPETLPECVFENGTYSISFQSLAADHLAYQKLDFDLYHLDGTRFTILKTNLAGTINLGNTNELPTQRITFPEYALTKNLLRSWDMISLTFRFSYLKQDGQVLRPAFKTKPALMSVVFPPQNIAEEAFFIQKPNTKPELVNFKADGTTPTDDIDKGRAPENPKDPGKVQSRIAGATRLVFTVPENSSIPLTIQGLLEACHNLLPNLAPTALSYFILPVKPITLEGISRFGALSRELFVKPSLSSSIPDGTTVFKSTAPQSWISTSNVSKIVSTETETSIIDAAKEIWHIPLTLPPLLPPEVEETAIEAPYRLLISPNQFSAWEHDTSPIRNPLPIPDPLTTPGPSPTPPPEPSKGRDTFELWHSRLIVRNEPNNNNLNTIRAIWARDWAALPPYSTPVSPADHYNPADTSRNPFRMSLDAFDRKNIVFLSANHNGGFTTAPVQVENLMLSSFGAWLKVRGEWQPPSSQPLSVEEWMHRATMGRDHYVKVVYKGYLFPFGNRASLVKVTERKFTPTTQVYIVSSAIAFSTGIRDQLSLLKINANETGRLNKSLTEQYISLASSLLFECEGKKVTETSRLINVKADDYLPLVKKSIDAVMVGRGVGIPTINSVTGTIQETFRKQLTGLIPTLAGTSRIIKTGNIAYLFQRMYIVVKEPLKDYLSTSREIYRQWPFSSIHIKTVVTPDLGDPTQSSVPNSVGPSFGQSMFWPRVGNTDFPFVISAEDYNGNITEFTAPLIFIENPQAKGVAVKEAILDYEKNTDTETKERYERPMFGQSVLFADGGTTPEKTTFETESISFDAKYHIRAKESDEPWFDPVIKESVVRIPALKNMLGKSPDVTISYSPTYITNGFDGVKNKGEVFVEVKGSSAADFNSSGDKAGGLIKPNIQISGLSRALGPVGGNLSSLYTGTFNPTEFFKGIDAKIFGAIDLWSILKTINDFTTVYDKIMKMLPKLEDNTKTGGKDLLLFEWRPAMQDWNNLFIASDKGKTAEMQITVAIRNFVKPVSGTVIQSDLEIICSLENFRINLIGSDKSFILIGFEMIGFHSSKGRAPEVDVKMSEIQFVGVLSFVEGLKGLIPKDGFSKPAGTGSPPPGSEKKSGFSLDVTEKGICSSFSLSLPNIAIGMFSLENLSLGAAFTLPFISDPLSFRFNFCERQSPFLLTVSMLGGGGFFAITLNPAGVQLLEASFEFGARLSVNFGVASGGVHIMAGIYYKMEMATNTASLTGYLSLGGEVSVLGIINASIELYLSLTYEFSSGKVVGRATLTIEIEILFFSVCVQISCERKFAGSNGDPTLAALMDPYRDPEDGVTIVDPWRDYWEAFE